MLTIEEIQGKLAQISNDTQLLTEMRTPSQIELVLALRQLLGCCIYLSEHIQRIDQERKAEAEPVARP